MSRRRHRDLDHYRYRHSGHSALSSLRYRIFYYEWAAAAVAWLIWVTAAIDTLAILPCQASGTEVVVENELPPTPPMIDLGPWCYRALWPFCLVMLQASATINFPWRHCSCCSKLNAVVKIHTGVVSTAPTKVSHCAAPLQKNTYFVAVEEIESAAKCCCLP
jgi:hypothetical protein